MKKLQGSAQCIKSGMPTSGNQKAGDFSILAGVLTKKREVEDEKAGDSKYMLFKKIYHE